MNKIYTTEATERTEKMEENILTEKVIGCAIKVHKEPGPGLLESAYEACLFYELLKNEIKAEKQKPLPLKYFDITLDCGYRIDILVEDKLILEIKSVDLISQIHSAQMLTYLKLSKCRLGLLINFNVQLLKNGLKRFIL
jgi:GxxExxY protein